MKLLTCKDASHLISDRVERKLSFQERWALRLHLWICASCRQFVRQLDLMRLALRKLGERAEKDAAGKELPPEARERIRKALAERHDHEHDHER